MKTDVGIASVSRRYRVGAQHRILLFCIVLTLAACTGRTGPGFRDTSAPIGGISRFDATRAVGNWHVVARFANDGAAIRRTTRRITLDERAGTISIATADAAGPSGVYRERQVGVLDPVSPPGSEPLVVMWVDEGFRTMVLGLPSGRDGYVLDRMPRVAEDRYAAAVKILGFYGWDTARLKRTVN